MGAQHVPANATPVFAGGATQNCPTRACEGEPARAYSDQALLAALAPLTLAGSNKPTSATTEGKERGGRGERQTSTVRAQRKERKTSKAEW